jgi:hypothetical protein
VPRALLRLPISLFSVKPAHIMKSPKARFVVISAIGLACILGIFVFAQSPTPTPTPSGLDLPIQLVMRECAPVGSRQRLMFALETRPENTYRIRYENENPVGSLPDISPTPSPCGTRLVGNATQRATFPTVRELHAFMDIAGF